MSEPVVLGIESTCDETAAAIVRGRELLSNVVASSMEEHARYGGVIPEIALPRARRGLRAVRVQALADANMTLADVDAIAVSAVPDWPVAWPWACPAPRRWPGLRTSRSTASTM